MIEIDGSVKSGSGTIVRHSVSLASLLRKELRIVNIRAKSKKPGLRPQHLKAIHACCHLTGGSVKKAIPDSTEIIFLPGKAIKSGGFRWDIGTAGSTTLMAQCLLPLGFFADARSSYVISGGLFQDFAPNAFHVKHVLMELLKKLSLTGEMEIIRPGYYPRGSGVIKVVTEPMRNRLKLLRLVNQGMVTEIEGIAVSSHLEQRKVSHRMANACQKVLAGAGYKADIKVVYDNSAIQRGAALFVCAFTDTGCIIGSDMCGGPDRTAEHIGESVAAALLEDIRSGATVDRHTADQLILYAALADGVSEYIIPRMTDHVDSNMWLAEKILGAKCSLHDNRLRVEGVGLDPTGYSLCSRENKDGK